jgi:DNA-binding beta-propeller fold protein YncE
MVKRLSLLVAFGALALAPAASAAHSTPLTMAQVAGAEGCISQADPDTDPEDRPKCENGKSLVDVDSVTLSADGTSLYAGSAARSGFGTTSRGHGGIAVFARAADGGLEQRGCITNDSGNGLVDTHGACSQGAGLASVEDVVVVGDQLYAVSRDRSALTGFTRAAGTGLLEEFTCLSVIPLGQCEPAQAILRASGVAASPDGKFVYVASSAEVRTDLQTDAIAAFSRDPATGALTQVGCVSETGNDGTCETAKGIAGVDAIALSADGKDLYSASGQSIASFRRDADTGKLAQSGCITEQPRTTCSRVKPTGEPTALAASPDGKNVYVTSDSSPAVLTYKRDAGTGKLSFQACNETPATTDEDQGDEDTEEAADDPSCGTVKAVSAGYSVKVSPDGSTVVVTGDPVDFGGTITTLKRDESTGELTAAGCVSSSDGDQHEGCAATDALSVPVDVELSPDGRFAYVADPATDAVVIFSVAATVKERIARVGRSGRAKVVVSCPRAKAATCRGSVRLARIARKGALRPLTGVRRFALAPGHSRRLALRLTRRPRGRTVAVLADRSGVTKPVTRRVELHHSPGWKR